MGNYELALYVKNVTDEVAYLSMFNNFQQENRVTPSQPRTVGLTFDAKF
jgi:outer membrane receptor protein involved in Fe transport